MVHALLAVAVGVGLTGSGPVRAAPDAPRSRAESNLASEIELLFTENVALSGLGLQAEVAGNTVVLSGAVRSDEDSVLAARLARSKGALRVDNRIEVAPPPPEKQPGADDNEPMTNEQRLEKRRRAAARQRAETPVASPAGEGSPFAIPPEPPPTFQDDRAF